MNFSVPTRYDPLLQLNEVPSHYLPYRMPGAWPLYVKGKFGDYLTQTITTDGCSMQLNLFRMIIETLLHPYSLDPVLPLHFMLRGNIRCLLKGFGEAWLREKRFHLFYVPGEIRHQAWFKPGFYQSFHIDFSSGYLLRLASRYNELDEVINRIRMHSAKGVQQHAAHITPQIVEMVKDCTASCPVNEPEKGVFMEIRSKELLLKYVQDMPMKTSITREGIQMMEDIAAYVTDHLDYPHTISALAKQFHISEISFRRQFEQHTGSSFGHFLFEQRMNKAKELLITTHKHIRDIAASVGYFDLSSFDRAFVRKFGHSPHYYRS